MNNLGKFPMNKFAVTYHHTYPGCTFHHWLTCTLVGTSRCVLVDVSEHKGGHMVLTNKDYFPLAVTIEK